LPAETELKDYAKLLADNTSSSAEEWKDRLRTLKKGECWSIGPSADTTGLRERPYKIKITSFDDRDLTDLRFEETNEDD
jgi:DNA phosphorothioation-dependent restriction protein DptH